MSTHPPRSGGPKPAKQLPLPAEWRIELPEHGAVPASDADFGGCRSIDAGYQREYVLGQGTYGEVYLAIDKSNGDKVAAKKIKMDNEKEGFPITAIREIKILSALRGAQEKLTDPMTTQSVQLREHIIGLREIVRSGSHKVNNYKGSIYMIFDFMDHDMTGLLERSQREGRRFTAAQVKCYLKQLFCGLWLLDLRNVLHRDLKNANLLVNNQGQLKIADFGLARYYTKADTQKDEDKDKEGDTEKKGGDPPPDPRLTNRVITLWYRPPELLLGCERYGTEIDTWSAGCIMFELITGKPLFAGKDEADQAYKIFNVLGKPTEQNMPGCTQYPNYAMVENRGHPGQSRLRSWMESRGVKDPLALDLLEQLLRLNPAARIKAEKAVTHTYFFSDPWPAKPEDMPKFPSSHEMAMKRARQEQRGGHGRGPQHGGGGGHAPHGGPPAQRQRTQGHYAGPQPSHGGGQQGHAPYRVAGPSGQQQPHRGGGGGAAPAAGVGRMGPVGHGGAAGLPQGVRVLTAQELQMMAGNMVPAPIMMPGAMLPPQGQGSHAYGRGGGYGAAPGGTSGGAQPHRFGGGAQPSWGNERR